jgi:hypothetical protein
MKFWIRSNQCGMQTAIAGNFKCAYTRLWEDLYFHCTAVNKNCPFDELRVNDEVSYEVRMWNEVQTNCWRLFDLYLISFDQGAFSVSTFP